MKKRPLLTGALLLLTIPALAAEPRQAVVVTTQTWSDVQGAAQRYERAAGGPWMKVGASFPVVVGKTGLGWGRGLQKTATLPGPDKQEGDGRAPAGVFPLTRAFGYDPIAVTGMPYMQLTDSVECVDDPKSVHYNTLVDSAKTGKDWDSTEHMHRSDELYHFGVFVAHNTPAVAGAGSCIFLHIWSGPDNGTVGCTAMERNNIEMLLAWLDPKKSPVLMQMPAAQYAQYRTTWNLP
jgi:zinc D-Ala-D-Ala dipeptidase